jgi:WS/DGAT/MGAT family acyltransferase
VLNHFESRLHQWKQFRRKLVELPLGIDRPYWVEEPEIDLEYHVRHIALPRPGDWRQLMIQVARLHSRPLDRAHPLWEAYVIEGLDNIPKLPPGAFAIFLKIHHAIVDGMAAVHLMRELHTSTPDNEAPAEGPRTVIADRDPSGIELFARGVDNNVRQAARFARLSAQVGTRMLAAGRDRWPALARGNLMELASEARDLIPPTAPHTRFSEPVSPHRVMEAFGMPLSRIRRIRSKVPGSTLNDIFVAVAGGAARKYLDGKGELPAESLTALMPISLRSDASAGGNEVAGVPVCVRSDIGDPIERLQAVHRETLAAKARGEKMGLDLLKNLLDVLPSFAANQAMQQLIVRSVNLTVSNVRGPDEAMYLAGAKAMCLYPVSIPADGVGLNFTGVSYNGVMWVSMVSCREMMPDPGYFLECMRGSWEELLAAADALPPLAPQGPHQAPARNAAARPGMKHAPRGKGARPARRKSKRGARTQPG